MAVIISASPGSGLPTISELTTPDATIMAVEKQLAMDFDVYRALIKDEIRKSHPAHTEQVKDVLKDIHSNVEVLWEDIFNPAIRSGFLISGHGIPDEVTQAAVGRYSGVLAEQVNAVSDQAFLEGYNAALSKGWDRAVAWDRIAQAYGIDPLQMRGWVSAYPVEGYHPHDLPDKSADQLEKMIDVRSKRIGKSEALTLRNLGKQAMWENQLRRDQISGNAKKVWRTAKDELVCEVCAPMDSIAIPIEKKFKTDNGKFYVPPVHINCRCDVYILNDENDIIKSMGSDRYNRDSNGRFSRTEGRTRSVGERSTGKRGFSHVATSEKKNAFGVRHEKQKTKEELEQERIEALPEKMPDLQERMPAWGQQLEERMPEQEEARQEQQLALGEEEGHNAEEGEEETLDLALRAPAGVISKYAGKNLVDALNDPDVKLVDHVAHSNNDKKDRELLNQFAESFDPDKDSEESMVEIVVSIPANMLVQKDDGTLKFEDPNPDNPLVLYGKQVMTDASLIVRTQHSHEPITSRMEKLLAMPSTELAETDYGPDVLFNNNLMDIPNQIWGDSAFAQSEDVRELDNAPINSYVNKRN